jgi:3-phosphoshikimate 1-carboxyvinyltransferase
LTLSQLTIRPFAKPAEGSVRPPGSKSITNRALVCAALAKGNSLLTGALDSDDTRVMIDSLGRLGIEVRPNRSDHTIAVQGCAGNIPNHEAQLYVGNSGTTVRFLTALVTLGNGTFTLDGNTRMRERPIQDLLDALAQLGMKAESSGGTGCPPVTIHAAGLPGGNVAMRGDVSSQFLSGLLLAAPYAKSAMNLSIDGVLVSQPYVQMTLDVMQAFGVSINAQNLAAFAISAPQHYAGRKYSIEPDASAASYFWAAAAITGGRVTVEGLDRTSLQGDVAFCDCLTKMGCEVRYADGATTVVGKALHGIDVDMNAISDTVQTLAAVALFAEGPTTVRGVAHIRHKETDRIAALATELRKLGATVDEKPDGLTIIPGPLRRAVIDTYDDHRMAMSLSLVGLRQLGITINDPGCTAKTYPEFFADLENLRK